MWDQKQTFDNPVDANYIIYCLIITIYLTVHINNHPFINFHMRLMSIDHADFKSENYFQNQNFLFFIYLTISHSHIGQKNL